MFLFFFLSSLLPSHVIDILAFFCPNLKSTRVFVIFILLVYAVCFCCNVLLCVYFALFCFCCIVQPCHYVALFCCVILLQCSAVCFCCIVLLCVSVAMFCCAFLLHCSAVYLLVMNCWRHNVCCLSAYRMSDYGMLGKTPKTTGPMTGPFLLTPSRGLGKD